MHERSEVRSSLKRGDVHQALNALYSLLCATIVSLFLRFCLDNEQATVDVNMELLWFELRHIDGDGEFCGVVDHLKNMFRVVGKSG